MTEPTRKRLELAPISIREATTLVERWHRHSDPPRAALDRHGKETSVAICSFLYAKAWRAWRAHGGRRMVTYTLTVEGGASLRGAGWKLIGENAARPIGKGWDTPSRRREHKEIYEQAKFRWSVET